MNPITTLVSRSTAIGFGLLASLFLLSGPAGAAHHEAAAEGAVIVGDAIELSGKVVAVDKETRTVTIEGEQGRLVEIAAPEDSPNFDQIQVGDPVSATYMESLALAIAPVPGAEPGATVAAAVSTAPPGGTPGGAIAEQVQLRAVVKAVDPKTRIVTLDVPSGGQRELKARDGIDLEKVKVGEQVSVTLTRALAISIEKK